MEYLNQDIQQLICSELSLDDVLKLKRVCKSIHCFITTSKQLWLYILKRDVLEKNIPVQVDLSRLESASAFFVEHHVEYALQLHRSFTANLQPVVHRRKLPLNITWCAIIRSIYFIVASSNVQESRISLWSLNENLGLCAEYSVSGPIIDGRTFHTDGVVVIGLTIGSTKQHVQIIGVGIFDGNVKLFSLAVLSEYSDVRFVSDSFALCGVYEGDDTYPYMVNWKTRSKWRLMPGCLKDRHNLPLGMITNSACTATVWMDLFVVIMDDAVEVFRMGDFHNPNSQDAIAIATLPFTSTFPGVSEPIVAHAELAARGFRSDGNVLHFSYRTYEGCVMGGAPQPANFVSSASSLSYQIRLSGLYEFAPLSLDLIGINLRDATNTSQTRLIDVQSSRKLSIHNLPMMRFATSLDFDGAAGLIVIGTSKGDLCVVDFASNLSHRFDLLGHLPSLDKFGAFQELNKSCAEMDIPMYYMHLDEIAQGRIPTTLVDATIHSWNANGVTTFAHLLPPSWSSDWASFKYLKEWLAPSPRWPLQDQDFDVTNLVVTTLRMELNVRGDLTPLAFKMDAEEIVGPYGYRLRQIVVFRVGRRLYMTVVSDETDPTSVYYGALPVQYGDTFDANLLDEFVDTHDWFILTDNRHGDEALDRVCSQAKATQQVLDFLEKYPGKLLNRRRLLSDNNPELWEAEEWRILYEGVQDVLLEQSCGRDIDEPEM